MLLSNPHLEMMSFHGILSTSPRMAEFFELVKRAAPSDASILVRGDTGTGKELVARAIHARSRRADAPFRAINCATLSAELLASELFGHVKGAFTGAVGARDGLFKLVDGGTLFLDEIAEMPLDVQARLLRVLQEQVFVPMGGTHPVRVDVRVLSATLRSLRQAVSERTFRADLMYRVRVIPLFLPPLSERGRDVEALSWHFLEALAGRAGATRHIEHMTQDALDALLAYAWPGNIRELQNVMEHAFVLGVGDTLEVADLTPEIRGEEPMDTSHKPRTERELERVRLLEALRTARGRREDAARALGMSRTTLWRKLKEHQIT